MKSSKQQQHEAEQQKQAAAAAADDAANAAAAAEDVSDDEDEPEEGKTPQSKADAGESSAMESLTDVVEEKQMDEDKMKQAFQALRKQEEADKEAEKKRCVVSVQRGGGGERAGTRPHACVI